MSEEPIRIEGASPARAGESPRQLMRRAKQASRCKFPAEEKFRILLEGIRASTEAISEHQKLAPGAGSFLWPLFWRMSLLCIVRSIPHLKRS